MNRTFLSFILALLPIMVSADESGKCGNNLTWSFVEATKTLTISGKGAMRDYSYIGDSPWSYNNAIQNVIIESGVTSIGCFAFLACSGLTSITIPSSVTSIGGNAFSNCVGLTMITIPNSVTSIGASAFNCCYSLTSVTIPKSVSSIGEHIFTDCSRLISIDVEVGNKTYDSRSNCNAIIETETNTLIIGCNNTIIPSSVTIIGKDAFYCCRGLSSITIPSSVTIIEDYAFRDCHSLSSITIPSSVTSIGKYAFFCCSSLSSITIPSSLTIIEDHAFSNCQSLSSITIPSSVTIIEDYAFSDCRSLSSIIIPSSVTSIGKNAFAYLPQLADVYCYAEQVPSTSSDAFKNSIKNCILHVPAASVGTYKTAVPWSDFMEVMALTDHELSVDGITSGSRSEVARYTIGGQRANKNAKGLNIIRMSDGITKKVVVK